MQFTQVLFQRFCEDLEIKNPTLAKRYDDARASFSKNETLSPPHESALLLDLAPYVAAFIAEHLDIQKERQNIITEHRVYAQIARTQRDFIQRRVMRMNWGAHDFESDDYYTQIQNAIIQNNVQAPSFEAAFATCVAPCLTTKIPPDKTSLPGRAAQYAFWAMKSPHGRALHTHSVLFHTPQPVHLNHLIHEPQHHTSPNISPFHLRDTGYTPPQSAAQAHYCLYCHTIQKDSCSKGLRIPKPPSTLKINDLGVTLTGCPLNQKISEMNQLKASGDVIAALAMAMVDNPMLPATGHRICNDCMKACIFQKQDPVTIPSIETEILNTVLSLPHGVGIYVLLTGFNPLNLKHPYTLSSHKASGSVLVVGAGPAGFTLTHALLQQGHHVTLIDAAPPFEDAYLHNLKPLQTCQDLHHLPSWDDLNGDLEHRPITGFGGVIEYGITPRYNKNYLNLIRLALYHHPSFRFQGGVRFGGNITVHSAFSGQHPFDHIALCMGAGKPHILDIQTTPPNASPVPTSLPRGVICASDFLMTLQLAGAYHATSTIPLHMRLPVVVIGGGLTSMDVACEAMAYYPRYVEKIYTGVIKPPPTWTQDDVDTLKAHHLMFKHAQLRGESPIPLIQKLGGVTLLYRKDIKDSPAYRLNHEELQTALDHGVTVRDHHVPQTIHKDTHHQITHLHVTHNDHDMMLPARTLILATGTAPNRHILEDASITLREDHSQTGFLPRLDEFSIYEHTDEQGHATGQSITIFGDMHDAYAGSVVKAMASAKQGAPHIHRAIARRRQHTPFHAAQPDFSAKLAHITHYDQGENTTLKLTLFAPLAAQHAKPGQFFKLQALPAQSSTPLIVSVYQIEPDHGYIHIILLDAGMASQFLKHITIGDDVLFMGPNGQATDIPKSQNILLLSAGLGNIVLTPVAYAMKEARCTVTRIATYDHPDALFDRTYVEHSADHVEICMRNPDQKDPLLHALSSHDMCRYEQILLIAPPAQTHSITQYLKENTHRLHPNIILKIGLNAPMQCMLKGVCGRCIQTITKPTQRIVFACTTQEIEICLDA